MKPILHLAQQTALKLATDPQGAGFAADLQAGSWKVAPPAAPQPVRGLTYAPLIFGAGPAHPLFEVALGAFPHAVWSEFYDDTPWSRPFLPRFATGECIGPSGTLHSDRTILGLFILGPDTFYPAHAHPAEEFYIVLAGQGDFQNGATAAFETKRPGDAIFHASEASHAICTGPQALFAVYGWRGAIAAPSWYRDDMTDEAEPKKYPPFATTSGPDV